METISFKLKSFQDLTVQELYSILKLRFDVFVIEQQCFYNEFDNKDQQAYHLFFEDEALYIAAYLRYYPTSNNNLHLGRVVVAPDHRKTKLGRKLMDVALKQIASSFPKYNQIQIEAQYYLLDFYKSLGFKTTSNVYDDEGILHIKMEMAIANI